jgi:short-subunit dehydrogenase
MQKGYALVTGASSGIGWEIALQLAAKGHAVILVARRLERLEALRDQITQAHKVPVLCIAADLSEPNSAQRLFEQVAAQGLQVDILVNNAGVGIQGEFVQMEPERLERMFILNIHSLTLLTQLFAKPMMARRQGYILQVASLAAFISTPYVSSYAATKAYVRSFSEGLRYELKGTGVSLTTLYPGITPTEFNHVAGGEHPSVMNFSIVSAAKVAEVGLRRMFRGRRSAIPGFFNKVSLLFQGMLPRSMATAAAGNLMKQNLK